MNNLGVAIAGGHGNRREHDFYATPREATLALINECQDCFNHTDTVWEPACGDGAMARVFEEFGYHVTATDLVDRGYGEGGVDFLTCEPRGERIVTNPPFKLAPAFIRRAYRLQPRFFALLLKATFWNAASRLDLFSEYTPRAVMPLTWRLDFTGGGSPTMDCMWCVWGLDAPDTKFLPLRRPKFDEVFD